MKSFVLITDYVQWIVTKTKKAFIGTAHENDWYFYHDALSLMTAEQCKQWMKDNDIYKHWILPSDDLYDGYPDLKKKYGGNPIGNTPEIMPWDLRLNNDVHQSHDDHIQLTSDLPEDHPLKFSGSTAQRMSSSYCRLLDRSKGGCIPTKARVLQDINRIPTSMQRILDAKGTLIEDTSNNRGRRHVQRGEKQRREGRYSKNTRTKLSMLQDKTIVLHEHAKQHIAVRSESKKSLLKTASGTTISDATDLPVAEVYVEAKQTVEYVESDKEDEEEAVSIEGKVNSV